MWVDLRRDRVPDMDDLDTPTRTAIAFDALDIEARVDGGGAAVIHRADADLPGGTCTLAIKEPRVGETMTADAMDAFLEEAETWERLDDHPNVVTIVDWGYHRSVPAIALEFLDGGSLRTRIDDEEPIPTDEALWTLHRIATAVRHAHDRRIAHLDLKPRNVLFHPTDEGTWDVPKVGDWGLARELVRHSTVDGLSHEYAAPEQFDTDEFGQPGRRTDIYQLGVIAYELLTGRLPYEETGVALMRRVCEPSLPPPPSDRDPDLPAVVDDVVLPALEHDQSDRYQTVYNFADALRTLWDGGYFPPVVARRRDPDPGQRPADATVGDSETDDAGAAGTRSEADTSSDTDPVSDAETTVTTVTDTDQVAADTDQNEDATTGNGSPAAEAVGTTDVSTGAADETVPLTDIDGIGRVRAEALREAGIDSVDALALADPATVEELADFGVTTAADVVSTARSHPSTSDVGADLSDRLTDPRPTTAVHGVGDTVAEQLRTCDIETVADLGAADPRSITRRTAIPTGTAVGLVSTARDLAGSGDPVTVIEGIGDGYGERLQYEDIVTIAQLASADPEDIADSLPVTVDRARTWVDRARERVGAARDERDSADTDPGPTAREVDLGLDESERRALDAAGIGTVADLASAPVEEVADALDCTEHRAHGLRRRARIATATPDDADGGSVEILDGIGPTYADELSELGIETVTHLAAAPPTAVAAELGRGRPVETVETWVDRAAARLRESTADGDSEVPVSVDPDGFDPIEHPYSDATERLASAGPDEIQTWLDCGGHRAHELHRRARIARAVARHADPDADPVTSIEGIGSGYASDLAELGVETVAQLAAVPVEALATELGRGHGEERVREWIDRATCRTTTAPRGADEPLTAVGGVGSKRAEMLADLGIETAGELAAVDPEVLARLLRYDYTPSRIEGLQENARSVIE